MSDKNISTVVLIDKDGFIGKRAYMKKTNLKKRWIGFALTGVACLALGLSLSACNQKTEESVLKSEVIKEQRETVKEKDTSSVSTEKRKTVPTDKLTSVPLKKEQKTTETSGKADVKGGKDIATDTKEKTVWTDSVKEVETAEKGDEQEAKEKETTDFVNAEATEIQEDPASLEECKTPAPNPEPAREEHHHTFYIADETAPTCTSAGKRSYSCSCGLVYEAPVSMLEHDWVPITGIVHHDAKVKPAWDETVSEAWDEPVYENHSFCNACGADLDVLEQNGTDRGDHIWDDHDGMSGWHDEDVQVDTIHHEAETVHHPEEVISPPWDEEVVIGYRCSVCGTVK